VRRRRRIIQAIAILVALVPFAFIVTQTAATATTIYVPDNYPTIQGAVNAASPGDTIIVRDGTYTESVVVDKANLTIRSENGAEATLVQALDPGSAAFKITADMCLIEGFEVTALNRAIWVASDHNTITGNSFAESGYCIYLSDSSYNTVVYNDFKSHHCGISIRGSTYNTIEHNDFLGDVDSHNWGCDGIELAESSDNIVRSCTFRDGGIIVWQSYRNEIYDCQVNGKPLIYLEGESGGVIAGNAGQVILVNCRDMEVRDCEFWKASVGIQLIECSDCKIWNNTCRYCSSHSGISLARSYNNLIEGNSGYHNYDNISLWRSSNNTIRGNECNGYGRGILVGISSNDNVITSNTCTNHYDGISVDSSENNKIYLNDFFNNDHNVDIWDALPNIWNSPQTVMYTYNGNIYTSCLGNYWDDYTGSDAGGDGIGDMPYNINSESDNYPLMEPFENYAETGNQSPIADAGPDQTVTDTDGDGQEQVTLDGSGSYDPDGTIVCWAWTENGNTIMMLETPTVVTLVTGEHTITLEVTDDLGARDTDVVVITVIAPSVHTVSTPNTPSGPSSGQVGESLTFSTGGSTCSQGHSVQYRFDWGNGNYSSWSSTTSASYIYTTTGTYQVRAQARCASVTSITSGWSATKTVNIGETPLPENQQPDPPANLAQLDPSGSEIPVGDAVDIDSVAFRAAVTDPDADKVKLQVELRRLDEFGGNFDETKAGFKESDLVSTRTITTCTAYGLIDDSYHWRARTVDEHGMVSDWVQFGNNNISEADFTIASASLSSPVLLVHGFQLTGGFRPLDRWKNLAEYLTKNSIARATEVWDENSNHRFWVLERDDTVEDSLTVYISNYSHDTTSPTYADIRLYANYLADEIRLVREQEAASEVDIVAHSMGGLVARAYIENGDFPSNLYGTSYQDDVRKLVMLGTPNHGVPLAVWSRLLGESATSEIAPQQMIPNSSFLNVLNHGCEGCTTGEDQMNSEVDYTVIAGNIFECNPWMAGIWNAWICNIAGYGENDDLVSTESAKLDGVDSYTYSVDHWALPNVPQVCDIVKEILLAQHVRIDQAYSIAFACPVNIVITDDYGRNVSDNGVNEIPGATASSAELNEVYVFYLPQQVAYHVTIKAYEPGSFTMIETVPVEQGKSMLNVFSAVAVTSETVATVEIIPEEMDRVLRIDSDGDGIIDEEKEPVVIGEEEDALPNEGSAVVVGPNPVLAEGCVFWLDLPEGVTQAKLTIFGVTGQLLFETQLDTGAKRFPSAGTWNPVDQDGTPLANGPYIYVLIADGKVIGQGKMVIQR